MSQWLFPVLFILSDMVYPYYSISESLHTTCMHTEDGSAKATYVKFADIMTDTGDIVSFKYVDGESITTVWPSKNKSACQLYQLHGKCLGLFGAGYENAYTK